MSPTFPARRLQLFCGFLRFFASLPPSPILFSFPLSSSSLPSLLQSSLLSPFPSPFPSCVRLRVPTPVPVPVSAPSPLPSLFPSCAPSLCVCMYSHHIYSTVWINRVRLPILLEVSWTTGKNNTPLSPCVPENLVSRDGFSRPVPRQPAHLHTQAESGVYLRDSSRIPRRRPLMKPPHAIGSVPSLPGRTIAYCTTTGNIGCRDKSSLHGIKRVPQCSNIGSTVV